jgi:cytochrome P450
VDDISTTVLSITHDEETEDLIDLSPLPLSEDRFTPSGHLCTQPIIHALSSSMALAGSVLIFCLLACLGYYFVQPKRKAPNHAVYPDGPNGQPVLGNLLQIPPVHSWLKFSEWSKRYGPLFRLNIAGRNHVIVSTEEIANDLLRERGTIYSDREQLPMAAQLLSDNLRPLFLPYGDTWRKVRKLMHNLTNVSMATAYQPLQESESIRAVRDLINDPENYETWFERFSAGLILKLAYDKPIVTGEELYVRRILQVVRTVERVASPGAYLVDAVPALMYLPSFLAPFKREAARLHQEELNLFREVLKDGVEASSGKALHEQNFCGKWFQKKDAYGISDDHAAYAIGTLFEAGAGTTAAAMMSFMLAMTLHPDEYKKLQAEVDNTVGNSRVPSFTDMQSLPRVRAVAKEVLRWRPVTAGGLPHQLVQDDTYKMSDGRSVFLEAGTNVHAVQWSIHREPVRYPDPESFRPERWLEPGWPTFKEPLTQHPNLQNFSAFGFGRRICPGQHIAERSLYILIARIAWSCDISMMKDRGGDYVPPPSYDYVAGFNVSVTLLLKRAVWLCVNKV